MDVDLQRTRFLLLGVLTSLPILVKSIKNATRRVQGDGHSDALTDGNRFCNLSVLYAIAMRQIIVNKRVIKVCQLTVSCAATLFTTTSLRQIRHLLSLRTTHKLRTCIPDCSSIYTGTHVRQQLIRTCLVIPSQSHDQ